MFELFNPKWRIPFIGISRVTLIVSAIAMVVSLGALFRPGLDFALDFTGGTVIELQFDAETSVEEVETILQEAGYNGAQVQSFGSTRDILVRLRPDHDAVGVDEEPAADAGGGEIAHKVNAGERVHRLLAEKGRPSVMKRNESVGPQIGKELANDAVVGIVFVMAGIMLYVAFRYEWRFGMAALAGELHDCLITAGFIALSGLEFDLQAMAALLTVAGYSINDKIVIFDRIREMFRSSTKMTPRETIDAACSDTLSRTVITGVTTLMALVVMYLLGGETLQGFSLILIVGIVVGTYSSVLFASPLLLHLGVTKQDLMPKMRDETELARRP